MTLKIKFNFKISKTVQTVTVLNHLFFLTSCFMLIFTLFHVQISAPPGACRFLVGLLAGLLPSEYFTHIKIYMFIRDALSHLNEGVRSRLCPDLECHCTSSANMRL